MEKQEMTTPLNRFFAFWWILAVFAVFGLLALVAYLLGGKKEDKQYTADTSRRTDIRSVADKAQFAKLAAVNVDFAEGAKALSAAKPAPSSKPAPGTKAYEEKMIEIQEEMERAAMEKLLKEAKEKGAQMLTVTATANTLQFVEKTLTAKAGKPIVILFKNPDPLTVIPEGATKGAMGHNFVLCKPGTLEAVAKLAMTAMDTDYIPETDDIIAHTKMLYLGQSDVASIEEPLEPGEYPYVCTFPGHYIAMKGVLTITAE